MSAHYVEYLALNPDWDRRNGPRVQISVARIPRGEKLSVAVGHATFQHSEDLGRRLEGGAIQLLFPDFDLSWTRTTRTVR
jgi:hypothetical protein